MNVWQVHFTKNICLLCSRKLSCWISLCKQGNGLWCFKTDKSMKLQLEVVCIFHGRTHFPNYITCCFISSLQIIMCYDLTINWSRKHSALSKRKVCRVFLARRVKFVFRAHNMPWASISQKPLRNNKQDAGSDRVENVKHRWMYLWGFADGNSPSGLVNSH